MTKKTNNGVDKTLRRLSLDRETPKSAFILLLLLYGIATFLTRSSSNTQAEITLFGETMRFSALTGVFSMLGSTCIIVLVMLFRKVGYFTAMFLLIVQLLFSGGFFQLEGFAKKITVLTVSSWGLNSLCAIGRYNEQPMVTLWNTIFKIRDSSEELKYALAEVERAGQLDNILVESGKAMQVAAYEMTKENIYACWAHLALFAVIFAVLSIIVLEFIDNDRR